MQAARDCCEALEEDAARFFGSEASLFFSSGFAANSAIFSTLPAGRDLIVHDALIHASAHEGMRLGRAATVEADHNDVDAFADRIAQWRAAGNVGRVWIAVESVYSMDGDVAPLADLAALADREDAFLVIDEAHGTGVFWPTGWTGGRMSSRCAPAARRWAAKARWSALRTSLPTCW